MKYGNRNRKFGWLWLAVFMTVGLYIQTRLVGDPKYAENLAEEGRTLLRSAHAHGNLLAMLNLLYGLYIDSANLGDGTKNIGSILAILGAIFLPIGLLGMGFGIQPLGALTILGGPLLIAAVIIIAIGHLKQPSV